MFANKFVFECKFVCCTVINLLPLSATVMMDRCYPNFQVVFVQKINDEKLYYFILPFSFFTSDCIGKRVCVTFAKSVHDENLEEIKIENAQELIQIYTTDFLPVKLKPNITLF